MGPGESSYRYQVLTSLFRVATQVFQRNHCREFSTSLKSLDAILADQILREAYMLEVMAGRRISNRESGRIPLLVEGHLRDGDVPPWLQRLRLGNPACSGGDNRLSRVYSISIILKTFPSGDAPHISIM